MKKLYLFLFAFFISCLSISAQTITVSGQCITGVISLNYVADVDGKPAYLGTGTVQGVTGVEVTVYWIAAPDNVWVIAFSGQPYFQNSCATSIPPGTANLSCAWTPVPGQTCTGAAALSVAGAVTVPVTLTNFTATRRVTDVLLTWKTTQEMNNRGFAIQKSNDGVNWVELGFVNGRVFSSVPVDYQFSDVTPYTGTNLYRLKQSDLDGRYTYSNIEKIDFIRNSYFTISDNPGRGIYKINMAPGVEKLDIYVSDASGKAIYRNTTKAGNQQLDLSGKAPGIYWLQLKKGNSVITEKLIKL
jgi:hypothetical protein